MLKKIIFLHLIKRGGKRKGKPCIEEMSNAKSCHRQENPNYFFLHGEVSEGPELTTCQSKATERGVFSPFAGRSALRGHSLCWAGAAGTESLLHGSLIVNILHQTKPKGSSNTLF